jgi:hypothetical protein
MVLPLPLIASQEVYYGSTTPSDVAAALVKDQGSAAGDLRLYSLVGVATAQPPDAPSPTGAIRLTESFISPAFASPGGYPSLIDDILGEKANEKRLLGSARREIQGAGQVGARTPGAAEYRYGNGQNGKEANWDIQFEDVPEFDPAKKNYNESKIQEAIRQARTAIRANPNDTGPYSGYAILFEAAYEATVPYTYAGNAWRAKAEKERTNFASVPPPSISGHISRLETAATRYRKATAPLLALLNHPVESRYLWQPRSFIGLGAAEWGTDESLWSSTWDQLLFESYIEAVTKLAECQFEKLQSRYFLEYRSPDSPTGFNRTPLLAAIDAASAEIEQLMLPISAASAMGLIEGKFDTSTPLAHAARIRRLKDNVNEYALAFDIGLNPSDRYSFGTYGPNYVPFLIPVQLASRPFTFDNFRALVFGFMSDTDGSIIQNRAAQNSLVGISIEQDAIAAGAIEDTIQSVVQLDNLKFETQSEYIGQLSQLCGQRLTDPNNLSSTPVPDLLGYFAPTEDREPLRPNETYGDIALQWAKIDQAETRLLSAYRAFDEIFEEAEIIRDYGDERLLSYGRIANIQLNTGEQISALDYLSGQIRVTAIEQAAEERAKQAEKKNWFKAAFGVVVRVAVAVATSGASEYLTAAQAAWAVGSGTLVSGGLDLAQASDSAKSQAEMHRNIGRIEADAARRQAEIQAQQTRIRAMEGRKITLEQRGQEDNRIREGIHKLMIRVERQKLEILLAKQQLDFAELEHSNTLGRIAYLIEEYRRVTIRNAKSTLNRPDVRLRRDYEIQEAARSFRVAQEYAWLLARAADYRFGYNQTFRNRIAAETQAILQAQNGKQLETAVSRLVQIRGDFLGGTGAGGGTGGMAGVKQVRFSLRDIVAQSNHASAVSARELNGEWKPDSDTALLQPFPTSGATGSNDPVTISDKQFENYLRANLFPDPAAAGSRILRLRFPIGFEPAPVGETLDEFGDPAPTGKENPLRTQITSQFGHLIVGAAPNYDQGQGIGVFINMRNRGTLPGGFPTTATLKPIGTFYTTTTNAPAPTGVIQNLRVWNPVQVEGLDFDDDGNIRDAFVDNSIRIIHNADTRPDNSNWRSRFDGLGLEAAGSKLHERSPANDHWLLEIKAPNNVWSSYLPNARDIEVCMTIRGW